MHIEMKSLNWLLLISIKWARNIFRGKQSVPYVHIALPYQPSTAEQSVPERKIPLIKTAK